MADGIDNAAREALSGVRVARARSHNVSSAFAMALPRLFARP
jgi:hypothetical protein